MPVDTSNVRMNHGIATSATAPEYTSGGRRATISSVPPGIVEKGRQDPCSEAACPNHRRYTPPRFGIPFLPRTEAFPGYRWSEFPQLWKESVDNDTTAC